MCRHCINVVFVFLAFAPPLFTYDDQNKKDTEREKKGEFR